MYAMKLLALGAATACFCVGEADAMKLLVKKGYGHTWDQEARNISQVPAPSVRPPTSGGYFATKVGAIDSRVASYFMKSKHPKVRAIGKNRKVILVVLFLLIAFVSFAAATGSSWCTGPIEGTPDELVKRDFNDGTDSEHANGQFMTEYVDLDGNRADFEQVNVYVYDSQSAYLDARDNYAEVGEHIFVGVNDDGGTVIRGANIEVEGIDVNYHRQVLTGWENYGTRNMANLHVRAY